MPLQINDNIQSNSPKPLNNKEGKFSAGEWRPFNDITEAQTTIVLGARYKGLTQLILKDGVPTEYWYRDGVSNNQLIVKKNIDPKFLIEPWVDTIVFTYNGTNNTQVLDFTPISVWGETTLNRDALDPSSEFHYEGATIVLSAELLTIDIEYKLVTQYFKASDSVIVGDYISLVEAIAISQNAVNAARPSISAEIALNGYVNPIFSNTSIYI